jgi:hypothetical protein
LKEKEEDTLKELIVKNQPNQLKMPFMLWTARAVQNLIGYSLRKKTDRSSSADIPPALGVHAAKACFQG